MFHFRKNETRKMRRRLVSVGLTAGVLLSLPVFSGNGGFYSGMITAFASSAKEIKKQAEEDLEKTKENIDKIEDKQDEVKEELKDAGEQLEGLLAEQKKLKSQIEDTRKQVEQANNDLDVAQAAADNEYDSMKKRIQFMYENSADNSIWSAILDSDGISDMLNRIEYISDMYKSDRQLLDTYQDTVDKVKELTVKLDKKMTGLLELQEDYEKKQAKVETLIDSLNDKKDQYATQLAKAEQQKKEYQDTISKQAEIIRQQEAEAARRALEEQRRREEQERQRQQQAAAQSSGGSGSGGTSGSDTGSSSSDYDGGGAGKSGLGSDSSLTDPDADPAFTGSVSGSDVVNYALQFEGNPYVWGGNSLTNGCDCSGFVHLVYAHFGYNLPRYSQAFKSVGKAVSYSNMKAGDIVVYPGHVAIYMGNGCIVEAQSTKAGITANRSVDCHTITAIRRVL